MVDRGVGQRRREGEAEALGNATTNRTREAQCEVKVDERWRRGKGWNNQLKNRGTTKGEA